MTEVCEREVEVKSCRRGPNVGVWGLQTLKDFFRLRLSAHCIDYLLPGAVSIALAFLYIHSDLKGAYFDMTENCL